MFVNSDGIVLRLSPRYMEYTRGNNTRSRDARQYVSREAKRDRASSMCRGTRGIDFSAHTPLVESRSADNETI